MRVRLPLLPAVSCFLALSVAGCAEDAGSEAAPLALVATDRVRAVNNHFEPEAVAVEPGTTVTWAFAGGSVAHNVVGRGFESETRARGEFARTFPEPGTYEYACTLHRGMTGVVVVR